MMLVSVAALQADIDRAVNDVAGAYTPALITDALNLLRTARIAYERGVLACNDTVVVRESRCTQCPSDSGHCVHTVVYQIVVRALYYEAERLVNELFAA
jgi:hypothetical protein